MKHENRLVAIYDRWISAHGYPSMCAMELSCELASGEPFFDADPKRFPDDLAWLARFIDLWERASQ